MNNKKTLLISLLITATAIGFVETGVVQLKGSPLFADQEKVSLILKKGDETVEIQPGEKIFINDEMITYRSVDRVNNLILVSDSKFDRNIRFDKVTTINFIYGTKAKEYGKKGLLYGGLIGATIGTAITLNNGTRIGDLLLFVPICAGIDGSVLGIAGAAYGYTQKTGGQPYKLGSGEWEIAIE